MDAALIIDAREAVSPKRTGKGQWAHGLITELVARGMPLTLLSHDVLPTEWHKPFVRSVQFPERGIRWHFSVLQWLRKQKHPVYLSPTSFIVPAFAPASVRTAIVVHDLIAFHADPHDRRARIIERFTLPRAIRRAGAISCVSESTQTDLRARFPWMDVTKAQTVHAGPGPLSRTPWSSDKRSILCVATLCPRKNQLRLMTAYAALPPDLKADYELVLAGGRGWDDDGILHAIRNTSGVTWLGYVSDEHYRELLSTCAMVAYPSLYEGFGLPVLDAFVRGIPVLTSDRGSLREIAGDAALIVDPLDVEALTRGMEKILTDEDFRNELSRKAMERSRMFTWKETADRVLAALRPMLE